MSYYLHKESVLDGKVSQQGPYSTENEAKMALANALARTYEELMDWPDSPLNRQVDIRNEVESAVRTGEAEITNRKGTTLYVFSITTD